ncbi:hypothetical protein BDQ94DRAFT_140947 [Aspergillus welwitschiae]|uniref:Uncharacterized protein n=1 Tax=Aspergillus welwitschiae TaxID=1341132 RepID=A0A3F3Q6S8_9EURO|nr:hypothetical protein BDQ94DRAFT_140947 [Aspergillus welwitschiae]RDH34819.1 hypothetical protein BDQ94DRAFT_140947 [Aspergillus welwitschiae]
MRTTLKGNQKLRGHIGFLFMFSVFQNQFLSFVSLARPSSDTRGLRSLVAALRNRGCDATTLSLDHACVS